MSGKYIIVPITRGGSLETGLTPVIDIVDVVADSPVVSAGAMTELTAKPGWYKYFFAAYVPDRNYSITVDGGMGMPGAERFSFAGNESFYEDVVDVLQQEIRNIKMGPPIAKFE